MASPRTLGSLRSSLPPARALHSLWPLLAAFSVACNGPEAQKAVTVLTDPDDRSGGSDEQPDAGTQGVATGPTCVVTSSVLKAHRSCQTDTDCEVLAYRPSCCDQRRVVGISMKDADQLHSCVEHEGPSCKCTEQPDRADDDRFSAGDDIEVHCVDKQCRTSITTRRCGGDLQCSAGEVCVAYENHPSAGAPAKSVPGSNALYTYECRKNPCKGSLNCSCAAPLCDAHSDVDRVCAVEFSVEADVACATFKD